MSVFDVALEQVVTRVPEIRFVTLTDTDGIEVARKSVRTDEAAQSLATEYTTVLRTVVSMARDHGLGALRELQASTATLPADYRRQVLSDTHAVAWALLSTTPELPGWHLVGDWLSTELARG